ncbi:MAG: 2-amino-4-hydroxy-6-hydroxymethyldihydropteridine diphosphokinase [Bacteroidetes bacterium]|nr:2-amino-4-hydroxy-6-hydroxymethyldihydropteridine diphosphokinase [Bacteroidota bacterium]
MNLAYLLIGGNLGNRSANLQNAIHQIEKNCGKILDLSAIYETAAWGLSNQPSFYNQAVSIQTNLEPKALMEQLLAIETNMGRIRSVKLGPRLIDLDILLIDQLILDTEILILPHPSMEQRRFALLPLAEIAPNLMHPILQKTIQELLMHCSDQLDVQKL